MRVPAGGVCRDCLMSWVCQAGGDLPERLCSMSGKTCHVGVTNVEEEDLTPGSSTLLVSIPSSVPHCKDKIPKFQNKYSQKRNIGASVPISTFMRLWAIYIFPRTVSLFCWRKYVDRSWNYMNRSQTHECWNWGWGHAIPRKGIYKGEFRCSATKDLNSCPPDKELDFITKELASWVLVFCHNRLLYRALFSHPGGDLGVCWEVCCCGCARQRMICQADCVQCQARHIMLGSPMGPPGVIWGYAEKSAAVGVPGKGWSTEYNIFNIYIEIKQG